ncbi:MAG TPA: hypothetical protein VK034_04255 [Enhygromyxa sp.]|nr:hypothetical protein [Enhygromyxa sp.]
MSSKVSFEGKRELRWMEIGDCLVTYMEADVEFSEKLWEDWLEALRRPSIARLMLCSWGPTQPTHQQWRQATRLMRDRRMPAAVVTEARHNLALAKAASWLGTNIQSFRWHQLGDACDFLELDKADKVAHKARVIALRDRFGPVTSDADIGPKTSYTSSGPVYTAHNPLAASTDLVVETSTEIQTKLAEIQERLRNRERSGVYVPPRD